jgi:hypothetical protein
MRQQTARLFKAQNSLLILAPRPAQARSVQRVQVSRVRL